MFKRRIGPDPHRGGTKTPAAEGCPDIWELETGEFAVVGINKTDQLKGLLPETASCGDDERIVILPRRILIDAKHDIPED